ncbi:MAG: helix-turn-helix transcriptional regulator [bacterium]|nr:helix-turn-helix transcriptional regulator [bacterium]
MTARPAAVSPFGERLRVWRKRRGFSQMDLAIEVGTPSRHVSFLETGRSRPGRPIVLRLAEALQLSPRERNALLVAAGLAPVYSEYGLDDDALQPVRNIVARVLDNHDPFPAFAFAPGLRLLQANRTAERLFPGMTALAPGRAARALVHTAAPRSGARDFGRRLPVGRSAASGAVCPSSSRHPGAARARGDAGAAARASPRGSRDRR